MKILHDITSVLNFQFKFYDRMIKKMLTVDNILLASCASTTEKIMDTRAFV